MVRECLKLSIFFFLQNACRYSNLSSPSSYFEKFTQYTSEDESWQDFQLFDCSMCDNMLLGKTMDHHQLDQIIEKVGLKKKVSELSKGIDTTVGRRFD